MGTIQSDVGLVTGIDIAGTIDKLMTIAARPRDLLTTRTNTLQSQSAAVTKLMALLASMEYMSDNLGKSDLFAQRTASSSDSSALTATVNGSPSLGTYQFTPLRTVQSQQLTSAGYQSDTAALGEGSFSFRYGDDLARTQGLELLGGGDGFVRGKIRITDRSGTSAEIDLSTALTLDDALAAINNNSTINVTALAHGDSIRLIDQTGGTANLKVQEVGNGKTAASLGLAGIDAAASTADGADMVSLSEGVKLAALNDGLGVHFSTVLPDIQYTLRDGTTGQIDLSPMVPGGTTVDYDLTVGDVLARINSADPTKLQARISADGDRLELVDLTTGANQFQLEAVNESQALADLGLEGDASGGVIQSRRLLGGLGSPLLARLNGGRGPGALGELQLTDRSGATATVNLAGAQTVDDVLDAINGAGIGITASLNASRTGIKLVDSSGGFGRLTVTSGGDGLATAGKLQLAVDDQVGVKDSGDLHLAVIGWNTRLEDLNGGAGMARGTFTIVDSSGARGTVNLKSENIETVGDAIQEINRLGIGVEAGLNDTGDGIVLRDTAGGSGALQVVAGSSTTAADLHLARSATTSGGHQTIDGSMTYTVDLGAGDTLGDLRDKINELDAGLQASIFSDGSNKPYRLSLASERSGLKGRFVVQSSGIGLELQETVGAQDALLAMGSASNPASSLLLTSSTNNFADVVPGVTLNVKQASIQAVNITVSSTSTNFMANVKTFVDNYNKFRDQLKTYTAFDSSTNKTSLLSGDSTVVRLQAELPGLLSGRFFGSSGAIRSLSQLGISLGQDGTLSLDQTKLEQAYAAQPDAVEKFFTDEDQGMSARFHTLLEQVAGTDNSLLSSRLKVLQEKIDRNQKQIDTLNTSLQKQSDAMYLKFYRMELAVGKLQNSLSVISSLSSLTPYTGKTSS